MASAKFLEEALSTDVDETAVSALVGSLENQLVTNSSTVLSQPSSSYVSVNQNHVNNSAISNGGTLVTQKHIANGSSDGMNNIVLHSSADLSQKNISQGKYLHLRKLNFLCLYLSHCQTSGNSEMRSGQICVKHSLWCKVPITVDTSYCCSQQHCSYLPT